MKHYDISIIIPLHKISEEFRKMRETLYQTTTQVEIIYIIDESIVNDFIKQNENEKIVIKKNIGRGFMLKEGAQRAQGEIIVFLHADTQLPQTWDNLIMKTMKNPAIIGGAFSLSFDQPNLYLKIVIKAVTWLHNKTGILSGDRAMFVRTSQIKNDLHIFNTPIFEDAELSRWMQKQGKVVLLGESVITSADAFRQNGMIRHTLKIMFSSLWYKVGGDLERIFHYYYK